MAKIDTSKITGYAEMSAEDMRSMVRQKGIEPPASPLGVRRCHSVFFSTSSTVSSRFISCRTADTPNRKLSL